jgi:hypothetical protein
MLLALFSYHDVTPQEMSEVSTDETE